MPNSGDRTIGSIFVLALVGMSVAIFFTVTLRKAENQSTISLSSTPHQIETSDPEPRVSPGRPDVSTSPDDPGYRPDPTGVKPDPTSAPDVAGPAGIGPRSAKAVKRGQVRELVSRLEKGNTDKLSMLFAAPDDPHFASAAALLLNRVTEGLGYKADLAVSRLGDNGQTYLLAFERGKGPEKERHFATLEFAKSAPGAAPFSGISFDKPLEQQILSKVTQKPNGGTSSSPREPDPNTPEKSTDPPAKQTAAAFVQAILKQDYQRARQQCLAKQLPAEKVAALCFVFEDAEITSAAEANIHLTAATAETAWAITKIHSKAWNKDLEFGMELERISKDEEPETPETWRIIAINLSSLLSSYAEQTAAGEIPFTPMVKKPNGGESLVLFFPYDSEKIHPRAAKQLTVISDLLKADPDKKIRITGHTDALGTEDYNAALSVERAVQVREYLIESGISGKQIIADAAGETAPLKPNELPDGKDNPEGRAHNRRAEIFLDF